MQNKVKDMFCHYKKLLNLYLGNKEMTQVRTTVAQKRGDARQCCITQYGFGKPWQATQTAL